MYCNVPTIVPSPVRPALMVGADTPTGASWPGFSFANPKSRSFAPALVSMMLPGFRSQCVMPWRWALSSASAISTATFSTWAVGSGPFVSLAASVSPSRYSTTRKAVPSCSPTSCSVQMCGWPLWNWRLERAVHSQRHVTDVTNTCFGSFCRHAFSTCRSRDGVPSGRASQSASILNTAASVSETSLPVNGF